MWTPSQVQYLSNSKYIEIITIDDEEKTVSDCKLYLLNLLYTIFSSWYYCCCWCLCLCLDFTLYWFESSDEIEEIERVFVFCFMSLDFDSTIAELWNSILKSKPFSWKLSQIGREGKGDLSNFLKRLLCFHWWWNEDW